MKKSLTWGDGGARRPNVAPGVRNMLVVVFGEFCGTFLFLFLAFVGTQAALESNDASDPAAPLLPSTLMYIASSFGCSLAINVWIFYRVSGGMFNPAVTLGLLLAGVVKPLRALAIVLTQMVAAICASAMVEGLLPGRLGVNNRLGNGTTVAQGLFLEVFLTAQLVLTVYFLAVEKHRATFLAPLGVGLSAFIAHVAGTRFTGTSINPARSFGPDVVGGGGFPGYHWIFWVGPFLGAALAFAVYKLLTWFDYQHVNPGQDAHDVEAAALAAENAELATQNSRRETAA
ncbi:hypothetical protein N3K66_002370 [Trichothecium roseum]|uniref:Uncharacterized protein n=1 Tax=Trichothecium roseum TaxID=47278 RepID=A0ACC0VB75_9HYPO|nr:hypothetical protein N3K66_002370 [Trichothecium roseum]